MCVQRCCIQVLVESEHSAVQYGSLLLEEGKPIKQDMALDVTGNYLYAMTENKVPYLHHHHHHFICQETQVKQHIHSEQYWRDNKAAYGTNSCPLK